MECTLVRIIAEVTPGMMAVATDMATSIPLKVIAAIMVRSG